MKTVGRRLMTVLAASVAAAAVTAGAALAAAGDLDSSFGTGGTRLTSVGGGEIRDLALSNGKLLAAGIGNTAATTDQQAALVQYTSAGNVDVASFGTLGTVQTQFEPPFPAGTVAELDGIAVRPTGQVVAVGSADPPAGSPQAILVAQYTGAGLPDTDFSGDGVQTVTPSSGSISFATDVAIASDGDVVVAGESSTPGDQRDFAVARYSSTGALETGTFGSPNGFRLVNASTAAAGDDGANAIAIDPADGDIVLVGTADRGSDGGATESDIAVVRLTSAGVPDTAFGDGDGIERIDVEASDIPVDTQADDQGFDVAIDPGGRLLITGNRIDGANIDHFVMRLENDGDLDPTFGDDGDGVTAGTGSVNFGRALVRLPDGKIVVAGIRVALGDMLAVRYTSGGLLDTSFSGDGAATVDFGVSANANAVAVQADGKLVLAGSASGNFALARLLPDDPPAQPSPAQPAPPAKKKKCKKGQKLKKNRCVKKKRKKR